MSDLDNLYESAEAKMKPRDSIAISLLYFIFEYFQAWSLGDSYWKGHAAEISEEIRNELL